MTYTTAQLRKAVEKGGKVIALALDSIDNEVYFRPSRQGDRKPWVGGLRHQRFSSGELEIVWGPGGEPVDLGAVQLDVLQALLRHKEWYSGSGWVWGNRSTTLRYLESLKRKGLAICTDNRPYRERYVPSDLAYRQFGDKAERLMNDVLIMMAEQNGEWYPGCGWWYHNEDFTRVVLESWVKRGLVHGGGDGRYGLKADGYDEARRLGWK